MLDITKYDLTTQEGRLAVFEATVAALTAQGQPSLTDDGSNAYRGENGRCCSIGLWIPDSIEIGKEFENDDAARIAFANCPALADLLAPQGTDSEHFWSIIQTLHDDDDSWSDDGLRDEAVTLCREMLMEFEYIAPQ